MRLKDYTTICSSAPGEILAIIALRGRDRILARNREILTTNLVAARAFFTAHDGLFRWIDPEGGPVAFPEWGGPTPVEEFCQRVLQQYGVLIAHGELFEHPGQNFRLGMGRLNFPEALGRLDEFVKNGGRG